jgi:hypothetical protein
VRRRDGGADTGWGQPALLFNLKNLVEPGWMLDDESPYHPRALEMEKWVHCVVFDRVPHVTYVAIDVEVSGHTYKRQRIDVLIDFTSESGCKAICRTLKPGFICLSSTQVQTHICSVNAVEMCNFLKLKYADTAEKWWRRRRYTVLPLLQVRHGCRYPSEWASFKGKPFVGISTYSVV